MDSVIKRRLAGARARIERVGRVAVGRGTPLGRGAADEGRDICIKLCL